MVVLAFMNHLSILCHCLLFFSFLSFFSFFSLAHHIVARVQIKNLSDHYLIEWKPFFPVGKLVRGRVLRYVCIILF